MRSDEDEDEVDEFQDDKLETEAASQGEALGASAAQADASASDSPDEGEESSLACTTAVPLKGLCKAQMRCYRADVHYKISRKSTCYAMHLQMSSRAALQACRTTKQPLLREHSPGSWRAGGLGEACCRWGHLSPSLLAHSHHENIVSAEGPCLDLKHCQLCSLESARQKYTQGPSQDPKAMPQHAGQQEPAEAQAGGGCRGAGRAGCPPAQTRDAHARPCGALTFTKITVRAAFG